jgi:hypothetical protein
MGGTRLHSAGHLLDAALSSLGLLRRHSLVPGKGYHFADGPYVGMSAYMTQPITYTHTHTDTHIRFYRHTLTHICTRTHTMSLTEAVSLFHTHTHALRVAAVNAGVGDDTDRGARGWAFRVHWTGARRGARGRAGCTASRTGTPHCCMCDTKSEREGGRETRRHKCMHTQTQTRTQTHIEGDAYTAPLCRAAADSNRERGYRPMRLWKCITMCRRSARRRSVRAQTLKRPVRPRTLPPPQVSPTHIHVHRHTHTHR